MITDQNGNKTTPKKLAKIILSSIVSNSWLWDEEESTSFPDQIEKMTEKQKDKVDDQIIIIVARLQRRLR